MKFLPTAAALSLLACGKAQAPVHPAVASQSDCNQVYLHILDIEVNNYVDPDHTFSDVEKVEARQELDQMWESNGRKDIFIRVCSTSMNINQLDCALYTQHIDELTMCVKLFR
jgi:hypothetical protein